MISALYGSVRTVKRGKRFSSSFHEGLDIAALQRDRKGRPTDPIYAVADGQVAYANKIAGNSSYGKYVVLLHDDAMGSIYTLYAHLSRVDVKKGDRIQAGAQLGIMGNTATYRIPMQRGHLHFEIGIMLNRNFKQWFKNQKLKPDHGNFNGWNLLGVNPYNFMHSLEREPNQTMSAFFESIPTAFTWFVKSKKRPDYFSIYPTRWQGDPYNGTAFTMACCENGIPLWGRNATEEERNHLKKNQSAAVLKANEDVLGRNGRHLAIKKKGKRIFSNAGKKHLKMLLY